MSVRQVWLSGVVVGAAMLQSGLAQKTNGAKKGDNSEKVVVEGKPVEPKASAEATEPDISTEHTVTVAGKTIAYTAVAGTINVGWNDSYDAMLDLDGKLLPDSGMNPPDPQKPEDWPATARMFYTAYFRKPAPGAPPRPVMFLYNGGPGSATMWLHMGSFGPRRVVATQARSALHSGRQSIHAAGCHGSRVHRRTGHGLQPHSWQGRS